MIFPASGRAALDQDLDSILGGNDGKVSSFFIIFHTTDNDLENVEVCEQNPLLIVKCSHS